MLPRPPPPSSITFESEGSICAGRLYLPVATRAPCVVMANGFSGTMDWLLPAFAERFAGAGLAVLVFDYRYLGESGGEPRQIVDIRAQRDDLRRAVAFARQHPRVERERIVLWGTSLGGSHAIELAARDPDIAAVVLNMPALDAIRGGANLAVKRARTQTSRATLVLQTARLLGTAAVDGLRGALHLEPHYLAVYGEPGKAFFSDPELAGRFATLSSGSPSWRNKVAARFLLRPPRYREGTMERIRAPILVCLATDDVEVSGAFVKAKARRARCAEIREYPAGHFDMYHPPVFDRVVADQVEFLRRHLALAAP